MASVDERVPDLVLVDALMSPREEDSLIGHFRTLPNAGHLQTLTIPQLGLTPPAKPQGRSIFGKKWKRAATEVLGGCDPTQFVGEVAAYLSRACELKARIEQDRVAGIQRRAAEVARAAEADQADRAATAVQLTTGAALEDIGSVEAATDALRQHDAWSHDVPTFVTAEPGQGLAAGVERVRAEAAEALARELGLADERHRAAIAQLEAKAAERAGSAARDAQTAQALQAEVERLRHVAAETLTNALAAAEQRHCADIARLEAEAAQRADAAAREALAAAEAQTAQALAAEVNRVRSEAERALATELAAAEQRRRADILRLEAVAAERSAATARVAAAKANALEESRTRSAEIERMRVEAEQTLATELAAAEARHRADIARLETAAADKADGAAREALEEAEAQSARALAAELERVRGEAAQMLKTELAAAEERSRAEVSRVKEETQRALSTRLQQVQVEANHAQAEVAKLVEAARHAAPQKVVPPAADGPRPGLVALAPDAGAFEARAHSDGSLGGSDYYSLWRASLDGPTAEAAPHPPASRRVPGRVSRRWALVAAVVLVVLLTHDPARQSAVGQALAAGAAGVSQIIGVPGEARTRDDVDGPRMSDGVARVGGEGDGPGMTSQVAIEAAGFLVGVLFLLALLFIGQGVMWHILVVTFGVVLLMFAVMRPPPVGPDHPAERVTVSGEAAGGTSPDN